MEFNKLSYGLALGPILLKYQFESDAKIIGIFVLMDMWFSHKEASTFV